MMLKLACIKHLKLGLAQTQHSVARSFYAIVQQMVGLTLC